jgi:uncharacterized protein YjhX (UPF0386 family)
MAIYLYDINFYKQEVHTTIIYENKIQNYQIDILKEYETIFEKSNIKVLDIEFSSNSLHINISATFKKLLPIINSSKYKIINYKFYKKDKKLYLDINLNIDKMVKNNPLIISHTKDPFKLVTHHKSKVISKAIVGNFVLIDNRWYEIGDYYKKDKIIKIDSKSITLKNKNKEYIMEIFDE